MKSWAGWTVAHVRSYVFKLIEEHGLKQASLLCGVSHYTLSKFSRGHDVTLGTMVRIAEKMP